MCKVAGVEIVPETWHAGSMTPLDSRIVARALRAAPKPGATQETDIESGMRFAAFDSEDIGAGIDLRSAYPGYGDAPDRDPRAITFARAEVPRLPRCIIFTGGALDVTLADGSDETIPAWLAGTPLAIAPATVSDSSTATGLFVIW